MTFRDPPKRQATQSNFQHSRSTPGQVRDGACDGLDRRHTSAARATGKLVHGHASRRRADRTKSNNARPTDSSCQSQTGQHETNMLTIITAASLVASSHVRSEDAVIGAVLRDGLLSSAVIQRLVDTIDDSNVIVYLARGNCPLLATACVMMAGGGPDVRYIRINFRLPLGNGQTRRLAQGRAVSRDCPRTAACRRNRRVAGRRRQRDDAGGL